MQTSDATTPKSEPAKAPAVDPLRTLRATLAERPEDADLVARFVAMCLERTSARALSTGLEPTMDALSGALAVRPVASAIAQVISATAAKASPRLAMELQLRRARIAHECLGDVAAAAEALAEAWDAMPDERVAAAAPQLVMPAEVLREASLEAIAAVADGPAQREATKRLASDALEARNLPRARRFFDTLGADEPTARQALATIEGLEAKANTALAGLVAAQEAASTSATRGAAWHAVGTNRASIGAFDETKAAYRSAIKDGHGDAIGALDRMFVQFSRGDERRAEFEEMLTWAPPTLHHAVRRRLYELVREGAAPEADAAMVLKKSRPRSDRGAADALAAAEALERSDSHALAASRFEDAAALAVDHSKRLDALSRGASLFERAGQTLDAERLWRKVRAIDPRSRPALNFYRGYYEAEGDLQRKLQTLQQLHGLEGVQARRAEIALAMTEVAERDLNDVDSAIEAWSLVERDAVEADARRHARQRLRDLNAKAGHWHAWVELVEGDIAALPADATAEHVELLFALVEVFQDAERLPMLAMVQATYQRIVNEAPQQPVALERLSTTLEEREQWDDLLDVLRTKIEFAEPSDMIPLFQKIAELYLERIKSETQALTVLEQLLELDPENMEVVHRLRELYRKRHAAPELFDNIELELKRLKDPKARATLLAEQALLAEHRMLRPELAIERWRAVLATDASDKDALAALSRLHAEQSDWAAYVAVQEKRIHETTNKAARLPLLFDLGETLYLRTGDTERAEEIFRTIAASVSTSATARRFLQKLFVQHRKWPELQRLIGGDSGPLTGRDLKSYQQLLEDAIKQTTKDAEPDNQLAVDVLVELARVHSDTAGKQDGVFDFLLRAVALAPERLDIAERALAAADETIDSDLRLPALTTIAEHSPDLESRVAAWLEIAEAHRHADRSQEAFNASARALSAAAELGSVAALEHFERDAEASTRWEDALGALEDALSRVPADAPLARAAHHRVLGHVAATRLLLPDLAIRHLRWVLEIVPADPAALDELERIYFSRNDFSGLEDVYRLRADNSPSGSEPRLKALRALASLFEDALGDNEKAAQAYLTLSHDGDTSDETVDGLTRTMAAREAWDELAGAMESVVVNMRATDQRARVHIQLFDLYAARLDDRLAAIEHARNIVELRDNIPERVVQKLEAYLSEPIIAREAAPVLEAAYRRLERPDRLIEVLELRKAEADGDQRVPILDDLAMLYESLANQPFKAFELLMERFELAPVDVTTWDAQTRLATALNRGETLAEAWERGLDTAQDWTADARGRLHRRLGDLYHHELIEIDAAIQHMDKALSELTAPHDRQSIFDTLEILHRKNADPEAFVQTKLLASDEALSSDVRVAKRLDAARALAGAMRKIDEAIALVAPLFEEEPSNKDIAIAYFELIEKTGDIDALDRARVRAIGAATEPQWRDDLSFQRAIFLRDRRGQWENAIFELMRLIDSEVSGQSARMALLDIARAKESSGQRGVILEDLRGWYLTHKDDEGLIQALLVEAEFAPPGPGRAHIHAQAAELAAKAFHGGGGEGLVRHALQLYGMALLDTPDDADLLNAADDLARSSGGAEEWAEILDECLGSFEGPGAVGALYAALATARTENEEPDAARAAWERAVETAERDSAPMRRALLALAIMRFDQGEDGEAKRLLAELRTNSPDATETLAAELLDARIAAPDHTDDAIGALHRALALLRERHADIDDSAQRTIEVNARLEALLEAAERREQLVELLLERIENEPEQDARGDLLRRAAESLREAAASGAPVSTALAIAVWERIDEGAGADDEALGELAHLYAEAGSFTEVAVVLEKRADLAADRGDLALARTYAIERARTLANELEAPEIAVEVLAMVVSDDPRDPQAIALLRQLATESASAAEAENALIAAYRATDDHEGVADVLADRLERGQATADELLELAQFSIGDAKRAFTYAARGYALAPTSDAGIRCRDLAVDITARRTDDAPRPVALASMLAAVARDLATPAERADAADQAMALMDARGLIDPDTAAPLQRVIVHAAPDRTEVASELEQWAKRHDRRDVLAELLAARAMSLSGDKRAAIEIDRARMLARLPRQEGAALGAYAEAIAALNDAHPAHSERIALLRKHGRLTEEVDAIRTWLDVPPPEEDRAPAALRLFELLLEGSPLESIEIADAELTRSPGEPGAWVERLAGLVADSTLTQSAFSVLDRHLSAPGSETRRLELVESTPDTGDDAFDADVLRLRYQLQLKVPERSDDAYSSMLLCLQRIAEPEATIAQLRLLASVGVRWRPLAQGLAARHRRTGEARVLVALAEVLGDRAPHDVGAAANAAATWEQVLSSIAPSDSVRASYEAYLRSIGAHEKLVASLRGHAATAEAPGARITASLEVAELLGGPLRDPAGAAQTLAELDAEGLTPELRAEVRRVEFAILARHSRWKELGQAHERWRDAATDDAERNAIDVALARAYLHPDCPRVGDGIATLEELLARTPSHPQALEALTRFVTDCVLAAPVAPNVAREAVAAAELLTSHHPDAASPELQLKLLDVRLLLTDGAEARRALRAEMGQHAMALGRGTDALAHYAEALALAPEDEEVVRAMLSAIETTGLHVAGAELLCDVAERSGEARLYRHAAPIFADKLGEVARGADCYERYVAAHPEDTHATRALVGMYAELGDARSEAMAIDRHLGGAASLEEAPALRVRLGMLLADALNDPSGAIAALEFDITATAVFPEAGARLERLYARAERHADLVALYRVLAAEATDEAARVTSLSKGAQVLETRLNDVISAIEVIQEILAIDPRNRFALASAERIERGRGNWDEVDSLLALQIEVSDAADMQVKLWMNRATIALAERSDPARALDHLRNADAVSPHGPGADELIALVESLLSGPPELRAGAAQLLVPRYEARQDWMALINVGLVGVGAETDVAARGARADALATVIEARCADDANRRVALLLALLRQAPEHVPVRDALDRELDDNDEAVARVLTFGQHWLRRAHEDQAVAVADVAAWLAKLEVRLGRTGDAERILERALTSNPLHVGAFDALVRLYRDSGDGGRMVAVYRERVALADPAAKPSLELRLWLDEVALGLKDFDAGSLSALASAAGDAGDAILLEATGDPSLRSIVGRALLARWPDETEQQRELDRLEGTIQAADSPAATRAALVRLATCAEAFGANAVAFTTLTRLAQQGTPLDPWVWETMAASATSTPQATETIAAVDDWLLNAQIKHPAAARHAIIAKARVLLGVLERPADAERLLREALATDPQFDDARRELVRAYADRGTMDAYLSVANEVSTAISEPGAVTALWRDVLNVAQERRDSAAAITACRAILAVDASDEDAALILAHLLKDSGRLEELAELLELRLGDLEDPDAIAATLVELGDLRLAVFGDEDTAAEAWREAWSTTPTSAVAVERLVGWALRRGDSREAGEVFAGHAEALDEPEAKAAAWIEAAKSFATAGAFADATATAIHAIASTPKSPVAHDTLIAVLGQQGNMRALAAALESKARIATDAAQRAHGLVQAAAIYGDRLHEDETAGNLVAMALNLKPSLAEAHLLRSRLARKAGDLKGAMESITKALPGLPDRRRARALFDLAKLQGEGLGDWDASLVALKRSLDIEPEAPDIEALYIERLDGLKRGAEVVTHLERRLARALDTGSAPGGELAMRLIERVSAENPADKRLTQWFEAARQDDRVDPGTVLATEAELYFRRSMWAEGVVLLEEAVVLFETKRATERMVRALHRVGFARERLGQADQALAAYNRAHVLNGRDIVNLLSLGRILVETANWREALAVNQSLMMVRDALTPDDQGWVLARLGLASAAVGDMARARQYADRLTKAHEGHPGVALVEAELES